MLIVLGSSESLIRDISSLYSALYEKEKPK